MGGGSGRDFHQNRSTLPYPTATVALVSVCTDWGGVSEGQANQVQVRGMAEYGDKWQCDGRAELGG
jgi:hypothetical protein